MTATIGQVYLAKQVLDKLMTASFTGKQAFTIARLAKAVEKEVALFEEQRQNLVQRYADKDETGKVITDEQGMVHIADERLPVVNAELNDLFSAEVELNVKPIKMDWLEDITITPGELQALDPFVEE